MINYLTELFSGSEIYGRMFGAIVRKQCTGQEDRLATSWKKHYNFMVDVLLEQLTVLLEYFDF